LSALKVNGTGITDTGKRFKLPDLYSATFEEKEPARF
jgi:hypothetical protein